MRAVGATGVADLADELTGRDGLADRDAAAAVHHVRVERGDRVAADVVGDLHVDAPARTVLGRLHDDAVGDRVQRRAEGCHVVGALMAGIRGAEARERRERTHDGAGRRDRLRDGAAVGGRRGRRGRGGRGDAGRGGGLGRFLVLLGLDLLGRGRGVAAAGEGGRGRLGGDDERLRVLGGDLLHRRDGGFCRVAAGRGESGDRDGGNETGDGRDGHEAAHRVRAAAQATRGLRGGGCRGSGGRRQTSGDRDASRTALIGCRRSGLGCLLRRIELFSQWSSGASAALPQGRMLVRRHSVSGHRCTGFTARTTNR